MDNQGRRQIDNDDDFVRLELETAFKIKKPVIPILVDGAQLPMLEQLPLGLRPLVYRNAFVVRHEQFHGDVDRLFAAVQMLVAKATTASSSGPRIIPDIDVSSMEVKRVFVSHSTIDRDWVEKEIVLTLSEQEIKSWYATNDITSATQWEREIRRGLEACDWFLVVVSSVSAKSEWVKDELNWAIYHRPTKIIPVIKEHCNLWDFHMRLPRLQYIDFTSDVETARRKLILTFVKK